MIKDSKKLQKSIILLLVVPSITFANSEDNSEEEFDFDWNSVSQEMGVDIDKESYLALHKEMMLGTRLYDIYVNNKFLCQESVEILSSNSAADTFIAAIPAKILKRISLKDEFVEKVFQIDGDQKLSTLQNILPGAVIELNEDAQTVNISLPQIYTLGAHREIVNKRLWDFGIPAMRLNYDFDLSRTRYDHETTNRGFLSYDAQFNLGEWRFFARGNVNKETDRSTNSDIWDRHASTVLPSIGGKMKIGEFSTTSRYLPSVPIIGINIFEDFDQVEEVDRAYLPVISGFAVSSSVVTIRQGGRILRQMEVSPGPFEFNDLLEVTSNGNIEMEIKEKNGKVSKYIIPYSGSSDKLLKPGRISWSGAVGRYDDGYHSEHPWVSQFSLGYGWMNGITVYGGLMYSEDFNQTLLGSALDGGKWGAFSIQVENSHTSLHGQRDGNVIEVAWYKYFEEERSSIDLRYRRTIDGDISSISSVLSQTDSDWNWDKMRGEDYVRDELSISLSKTVADWATLSGSLYFTRSELGDETRSFSTSLGFPIGRLYGELRAQNSRYDYQGIRDDDWQVAFQLTIPLSTIFPDSSVPYSNLRLTRAQQEGGYWSNQVDFSSSFGRYSDWSVNAYLRNTRNDDAMNVGVYYDGEKTNLSFNAGRSNKTNTYSAHLSGGVLATEYGMTFSDNIYDGSVALVNVPNVEGARLYSSGTDTRGEWQVSNPLREFRRNQLRLDPESIPPNVYLLAGLDQEVIPADGAVIPVKFDTFAGYQAVFTINNEFGEPLPYCSVVSVQDSPVAMEPSLIDEAGQVYFTAVPSEGWLDIKWSEDDSIKSCKVKYSLENKQKANGIYKDSLTCKK